MFLRVLRLFLETHIDLPFISKETLSNTVLDTQNNHLKLTIIIQSYLKVILALIKLDS